MKSITIDGVVYVPRELLKEAVEVTEGYRKMYEAEQPDEQSNSEKRAEQSLDDRRAALQREIDSLESIPSAS